MIDGVENAMKFLYFYEIDDLNWKVLGSVFVILFGQTVTVSYNFVVFQACFKYIK